MTLKSLMRLLGIGVLLGVSLLLCACTTMERDILYNSEQITALNTRVGTLEEKTGPDLAANMTQIRERQANLGDELNKVKSSLQELSGRTDDNFHLIQRMVEGDTTQQGSASLPELNQRLTQLEAAVAGLYDYLKLPPPKASAPPAAPAPQAAPSAPAPVSPPPSQALTETELYDQSLATYRKGAYDQALDGFGLFLKKYPRSTLADNAQFWIGECHMGLKQYEQAILAYQKVIKEYPQGNKVPNAMLRQALAFSEINDKISARLLLKKVVEKYPGSSEAKIAAQKLKALE